MPTLVSSPIVVESILQHGSRLCTELSQAQDMGDTEKRSSIVSSFCIDIRRIIGFFNIFMNNTGLSGNQMREFHRGYEKQLFQFASRAVALIEAVIMPTHHRREMEGWTRNLAQYAAILYLSFFEVMDLPQPSPGSTIHKAVGASLQCTFTPSHVALELLCRTKDTQTCFAIGCTESFQTYGEHFQRCAQCRVISYCSKSCQKKAWSDDRLPHKSICKKIGQVVKAGGSHLRLGDHNDFARCMEKARIPDSLLHDITVWIKGLDRF